MEHATIKVLGDAAQADLKKHDAYVIVVDTAENTKKATPEQFLAKVPAAARKAIVAYAERIGFEWKAKKVLRYDLDSATRVVVCVVSQNLSTFDLLSLSRKAIGAVKDVKPKSLAFDLRASVLPHEILADSLVAAFGATQFKSQKYGAKAKQKETERAPVLTVYTAKERIGLVKQKAENALALARATNLVRWLGLRAPNDLTPKNYAEWLKQFAQKYQLGFKFYDVSQLKKMGAGAFLAVAQASVDRDAGIAVLSYRPKAKAGKPLQSKAKDEPELILVGKGVTFDTGGVNAKAAQYMFGMHTDMTGSAIATAVLGYIAEQKWPIGVDIYLALAANDIGPNGYRPNDVITSLKGTTIEIVHTDAEGRMMLADTLTLASRAKPKMMMDFATLTGSCVRAIGTNYSGVFTNREHLHQPLIAAGKSSGERVWPFPLDADYADCLDSAIADTKQCRLSGGVDHIEASLFLKNFIENDVPWVHVDLSSAEQPGGLGAVDTEFTGFGVRFAATFLTQYFSITY